jgi:hypothetical protein
MLPISSDMTYHILLNLNGYIDLWLNTIFLCDVYLESMEGHFLMIDCEKISCKSLYNFFLLH